MLAFVLSPLFRKTIPTTILHDNEHLSTRSIRELTFSLHRYFVVITMLRKNQQKKTPASQEENKLCAFCNKTAELKCAGCRNVYYCNKEHQKLDWKNHDNNCSALKLVKESSGRQYLRRKEGHRGR